MDQTVRKLDYDARLRALGALVGNTPILAIECVFRGAHRTVYTKAEQLNMTGSIKDRMALHIVRQGRARGHLQCSQAFHAQQPVHLAAVVHLHPAGALHRGCGDRERLGAGIAQGDVGRRGGLGRGQRPHPGVVELQRRGLAQGDAIASFTLER